MRERARGAAVRGATGALCRLAALAALAWAAPGCKGEAAPTGAGAADAGPASQAGKAQAGKLRGTVRKGDRSLKVAPMVAHSPGMDLFVGCRELVARSKGEAPLCYGPTKRARLTRARVEFNQRLTGGAAMHLLRSKLEAAHFVIESTGSVYQTLDLAYDPRRDGELQAGEVRILSASKAGQDKLLAALRELFPELAVQVVDIALPEARGPGAPPRPPPPMPPPPGAGPPTRPARP